MQQIADWLEKLGMSEYVQRFTENDIDFTILPELTDPDLEKIGAASLGHRRKILKAISALSGPAAPPLATVASMQSSMPKTGAIWSAHIWMLPLPP
jgi:hypothetical protein